MLSSNATFSMEMFPFGHCPKGNGDVSLVCFRGIWRTIECSQDLRDQLNAKLVAVQIILTGIDNDIYSIIDACPNACEMWKAIESSTSTTTEWQRFMFIMLSRSQELKTLSPITILYESKSKHQNEVIEIKAAKLARTANPLALVAQQQPVYHPQNHPTQNTQYSSTRSQQSTKNRGKAIVTSSAPTYDPEPATVTEDEEMLKEKEIDKLMALSSLSFKKIYKPTNNLQTSSNTSRANQYNSLRINRGTGYDNQRAVNVVGARENVGTLVVQKSGIQCYNCKEYGHVSRECQKPKRVKDAAYHKENMLLYKQEEAGVSGMQKEWIGKEVACGRIRDAFSVSDLHYRFTHSSSPPSNLYFALPTLNLGLFQVVSELGYREPDIVMSDSEDSTITYTEVSSPYEDLSDRGSPGVMEPPSPIYVPFISEPVYPEFMPPEDDVLLAEEQPLPAALSPTADSLGYVAESDPEEDHEEDPVDYPINGDDDNDDDESSIDDKDDDDDVEDRRTRMKVRRGGGD
ncbi:gag-pol polyprotein [Tanacetum coccineum]